MTRQTREMFAAPSTIWLFLVAMIQMVTSVACVEVNGGAAELSWSVRDFAGNDIANCHRKPDRRGQGEVRVESIRLAWKAVPDGGVETDMEPDGSELFPCADSRAVTRFTIPSGRQMLWIQPICPNGAAPMGRYQVPPPIVRTVSEGTVTTLDALLVVVDESTCQLE